MVDGGRPADGSGEAWVPLPETSPTYHSYLHVECGVVARGRRLEGSNGEYSKN